MIMTPLKFPGKIGSQRKSKNSNKATQIHQKLRKAENPKWRMIFLAWGVLGTKNGESAEPKFAVSCYGRYIGHWVAKG